MICDDLHLKIFVINLERSKDRLDRVTSLFEAENISFERIDAIDGKTEKKLVNQHRYSRIPMHKWFRPLTDGEIACALSHLKAYQEIIDQDLDYALILEDDFVLQDGWRECLLAIQNIKTPYDLIKLANTKPKDFHATEHIGQIHSLGKSFPPPRDALATLASRAGAKKMVEGISHIYRPIDFEMKNFWEYDLDIYAVYPNPFQQAKLEAIPSLIGFRAHYRNVSLVEKVKTYLRKYVYQVYHKLNLFQAKNKFKRR